MKRVDDLPQWTPIHVPPTRRADLLAAVAGMSLHSLTTTDVPAATAAVASLADMLAGDLADLAARRAAAEDGKRAASAAADWAEWDRLLDVQSNLDWGAGAIRLLAISVAEPLGRWAEGLTGQQRETAVAAIARLAALGEQP